MARTPRGMIVDPREVRVFHCMSRCVRRAYLCGIDTVTGKSFEHRRQWIQDRMRFLAGIFGIDVLAFAVMNNHLHVVLRNRPDVVNAWSDEEVARHWWRLFPLRRTSEGGPAEPEEHELQMLIARKDVLRLRLADVSWYMRCLSEVIARRANKEDECTGRFWEGRFKCQPLLDDSAVLACMAYVDLNPIRAGLAVTPEGSPFTSAYERIAAMQNEEAGNSQCAPAVNSKRKKTISNTRVSRPRRRDDWLAPLELARMTDAEASQQAPLGRTSNKGCVPLSLVEYLQLLDWTGRQLRRDKHGSIPAHLTPILERLQIQPSQWVHVVKHFKSLFRSAAGRPLSLEAEAKRRQHRWVQGGVSAKSVFL